jgi:hypothetical protein
LQDKGVSQFHLGIKGNPSLLGRKRRIAPESHINYKEII